MYWALYSASFKNPLFLLIKAEYSSNFRGVPAICIPSLVKILISVASNSLAVGFFIIPFRVPEDLVDIEDEVKFWSLLATVRAPSAPDATKP